MSLVREKEWKEPNLNWAVWQQHCPRSIENCEVMGNVMFISRETLSAIDEMAYAITAGR